jgi:hypothetical protein
MPACSLSKAGFFTKRNSFILGTPAAIVCIALVVGHEYYLHEK